MKQKDAEERFHVEEFLKNNGINFDKLISNSPDDPPDFDLVQGNDLIYLEHTCLLLKNAGQVISEAQNREHIISAAAKEYLKKTNVPIIVEYQLARNHGIVKNSQKKRTKLIQRLVTLVLEHTPELGNERYKEKEIPEMELPPEIEYLKIFNAAELKESHWYKKDYLNYSGKITRDDFEPSIRKKNDNLISKIKSTNKTYTAYWLLFIVLGNEHSFFYDLEVEGSYVPKNCMFDRIILYELREMKTKILSKGIDFT